ncbi:peptidase S8 [Pseudochryseolinea flava]|uniref:Peptidase S8 n=2 Tax=Pseudochryseolinea flava TaxID=2059302 RepID=A0A364Y149_9BACT|nr:peptidase S8 [Pseudochryseolinea flava]
MLWTAALMLTTTVTVSAQDAISTPKDWFLRDPEADSLLGVSAEKTYQTLLKGKPSRTVLVAVIDSGIDIEHEDLKDIIWINEDEIPGNNIDDDKNGYVDDIHGWNFIGGKNGNVAEDTYEVTREYARLKPKFESIDSTKVGKKDKAEYAYWKKVKKKYDNDFSHNKKQYDEYKKYYEQYTALHQNLSYFDSLLEARMGKPTTKQSLEGFTTSNDTLNYAKESLLQIMDRVGSQLQVELTGQELVAMLKENIAQIQEGIDHFRVAVEYGYNTEFNPRTVVGDDPKNLTQKGYGNNDVEGPDAKHGTHVAGIIGADRKNTLGIRGIADNVRIMSIRAVPNGDERDKDIANAIIYAADNGAKIINMSFGKSFSPNKELVDKAVKYAESKGVLLIHAAGNDGDNLDEKDNFPNRDFSAGGNAKNWLEIGASAWGKDKDFVGSFSNYGKKSVDLFAPGVQIYSTTPGNQYEDLQGTSMACPATSGVAAMLMSYFPDLTAAEVKDILRQSTRKFDGLKVVVPGGKDEVSFSELSSTGGLVNAYDAVALAMKYKKQPASK